MTSIIQRSPAIEPVTADELKSYLRLDDEDDAALHVLIASARLMVEAYTGLRLITQIWCQVFPKQTSDTVTLSHWPVRQLKGITVLGDMPVSLDLANFQLIKEVRPARVISKAGSWPQLRNSQYGYNIEIEVGFGSERTDVPEDLRHAVMVLAAEWYESNDWDARTSVSAISPRVMDLLQPHRHLRL